MTTALLEIVAIGFLAWGFYRARAYGRVGILAWLQSLLLIAPWLLFFGLVAIGVYLNLATVLFLFLICTGLYIAIGRQIRASVKELTSRQSEQPTSKALESPESTLPMASQDQNPQASSQPSTSEQKSPEPKPKTMPIPADELRVIQGIFGVDTFFVTETIPYQEGAIFKGNLRGDADHVYARLSASLRERVHDRYRLFLVENPDGKPVMIVLPSTTDPKPTNAWQLLVAIALAVVTIASCEETAGLLLGFDVFSTPARFAEALPIASAILAILAAHELGHRWQAARHAIKLSPPFFIPTLQIGTFGAWTRFESLLPSRSVLFDIAVAGPLAGGIVSLIMLIAGLALSNADSLFQIPSQFFQGSILVGTVAKVMLGDTLQAAIVHIHPLTVVGWLGLLINALNLMPAGQLDGGRIVQAIYGRKTASWLTIATIIVLGVASFVNPLALYWALVIIVL
ncbi:MAG: site-2 protease family protein, partial [Cyanobacteria bacterium]|nr:site-2 protease family protein [Cyanobacteriota bacterium]MDW8202150.1 site-2 protease family protein [Cyanobacteriota bacterium SKYGB_h_bin112]